MKHYANNLSSSWALGSWSLAWLFGSVIVANQIPLIFSDIHVTFELVTRVMGNFHVLAQREKRDRKQTKPKHYIRVQFPRSLSQTWHVLFHRLI